MLPASLAAPKFNEPFNDYVVYLLHMFFYYVASRTGEREENVWLSIGMEGFMLIVRIFPWSLTLFEIYFQEKAK